MPRPQPVVIVLCGGTSARMAGRDKTREVLAGTTVMDFLLDSLPPGWPVICVGEQRETTRLVQWCRESPVGGGPVAGIAAALDLFRSREHLEHPGTSYPGSGQPGGGYSASGHPGTGHPGGGHPGGGYPDSGYLGTGYSDSGYPDSGHPDDTGRPDGFHFDSGHPDDTGRPDGFHFDSGQPDDAGHLGPLGPLGPPESQICVVVGGDMPFAGAALPGLVAALDADPGLDAVLAVDPGGRTQPLLAAYRFGALRAALPVEAGGARLMAVVDALETGAVACDARTALDVDTPEALDLARHSVGA
jgi:molybdopterin-guanine dinucleotide biosynthesis protein A